MFMACETAENAFMLLHSVAQRLLCSQLIS